MSWISVNSRHLAHVFPVMGRGAIFGLLLAALGLISSCVQIDGGAVEFSWAIRTPRGEASSCSKSGISQVRLCWQAVGESNPPVCENSRSFPCAEERGISLFEVEPGQTFFWIEPLCSESNSLPGAGSFEAPSPVKRDVSSGEVVTLNALLIIATDEMSACGEFCTCVPGS
jgi:hypothetical protein